MPETSKTSSTEGVIKVVGGRKLFHMLPLDLLRNTPDSYAIRKVLIWGEMLNHREIPVRWFRPGHKGTSVDFEFIDSEEKQGRAITALGKHIAAVNRQYPGHDLRLTIIQEG